MLDNMAVPKYIQLQNIIKNDILHHKYKNGEMIPSEPQLMKIYSVTRTTIRKALSNLVYEGLLRKEQGKGTFVNLRDITHSMWNFSGFTDYAHSKDQIPVSNVLSKDIIEKDGQKFLKLVRVRGMKTNLSVSWYTIDTSLIPMHLFPHIEKNDFSQASLYNIMKKDYDIFPKTASLEIGSVMGNDHTKKLLGYTQNVSLVRVFGSIYSDKNLEVEQVDVVYNPNIKIHFITNMA